MRALGVEVSWGKTPKEKKNDVHVHTPTGHTLAFTQLYCQNHTQINIKKTHPNFVVACLGGEARFIFE